MEEFKHPLAVSIRWAAVLWIVGWALYATIGQDSTASYLRNTTLDLGALLIPALIALVLSWKLERLPKSQDRRRYSTPTY